MSNADKALAACADYVRIQKEIKRLGREIGNTLFKCPGVEGRLMNFEISDETHLAMYYRNMNAMRAAGSYFEKVKGEDEFLACPHCVATHKLIQERKDARRKLGAVKRRITMIGSAK